MLQNPSLMTKQDLAPSIFHHSNDLFIHSNVVSECIEEKNVSTADPDSLNSVSVNFVT